MVVQSNDAGNKQKYEKCEKCGKESVHLAISRGLEFYGDQDDMAGDPSKFHDELAPEDEDIVVYVHICFECGWLKDLGIESPREKVVSVEG